MKAAIKNRAPARRVSIQIFSATIGAALVSGCATDPRTGQPSFQQTFASEDPCANNSRNTGLVIGAIAGAILGNQTNHSDKARIIGALAGAAVGGMIGHDMDQRRCELSKIAKQYNLNLKTATIAANGTVIDDARLSHNPNADSIKKGAAGMAIEIREPSGQGGHFETNSDQLTEQAQRYFSAIADAYNARIIANNISSPQEKANYIAQVSKRQILLIGHTDDTGNSRLNADLSERRARAVASYMEKRGIPAASLHYQGAGEAYPIADNNTEEGRAQNRRVEIVEVADAASFDRYLASRKPRYELYRSAPAAPATAVNIAEPSAPLPAPPAKAQGKSAPATVAANNAPPRPAVAANSAAPANDGIDFGGRPLSESISAADIGRVTARQNSGFLLISNAYAEEPIVVADCSRDRPRVAYGVKNLSDGKAYRVSEHLPGLYGKTWTQQVHGHQIVLNKVSVLANTGAAANLPEFKVYTNYDPAKSPNPTPALSVAPDVNTYLGDKGLLYRMFLNGKGGLSCVDVVFASDGGAVAKGGRLIYTHAAKLMSAEFKPAIYQK